MGIFSFFSNKDKKLDRIVSEIENDMSNNYKDAAQLAFKELKEAFGAKCESGELSMRQKTFYSGIIEEFSHKLQGYTHKDQKPYWTH